MQSMQAPRAVTRPKSVDGSTGPDPRDRILAAASVLFTRQGIARTGVDSLIARAGVAKATFYRHFPAKEDLVVTWLRDPRTRWFDRVRTLADSEIAKPADRIPALFEAAAQWLEAGDYRGCPYLNTVVELVDPNRPPGRAIREYLAEIGAYIEQQVALAGHPEPARMGRELHTLLAGSIALGVANRTSAHALAGRDAAVKLLG
jgi:AcrR family transcriptional regulator